MAVIGADCEGNAYFIVLMT